MAPAMKGAVQGLATRTASTPVAKLPPSPPCRVNRWPSPLSRPKVDLHAADQP